MMQAIETVVGEWRRGRAESAEPHREPDRDETIAFLRGVGLLREFNAAELSDLAARLSERRVMRGQALCEEGNTGDEMFFVRRGTVIVSTAVTGDVEEVLARFGPGEFFGEMSLFDGAPRSATVRAESDVVLLALDRKHFEAFVAASPHVAAVFFRAHSQAVAQRLRGSNTLVAEVVRWGLEATGLDTPSR